MAIDWLTELGRLQSELRALPPDAASTEFVSWYARVMVVLNQSLGADHDITIRLGNLTWFPGLGALIQGTSGDGFELARAEASGLLEAAEFAVTFGEKDQPRGPEGSPSAGQVPSGPGDGRSVFLVQGRDQVNSSAMGDFLRALGLTVIGWETAVTATGEANPYVGEVVRRGFDLADAIVVLLTPDDLVVLRPDLASDNESVDETEPRGQPRPNVIYELGMAQAMARDRTVIVALGQVKVHSDISGRHLVRFTGDASSRSTLAGPLEDRGLVVDRQGTAWLEAGAFDLPNGDALVSASTERPVEVGRPDPSYFLGQHSPSRYLTLTFDNEPPALALRVVTNFRSANPTGLNDVLSAKSRDLIRAIAASSNLAPSLMAFYRRQGIAARSVDFANDPHGFTPASVLFDAPVLGPLGVPTAHLRTAAQLPPVLHGTHTIVIAEAVLHDIESLVPMLLSDAVDFLLPLLDLCVRTIPDGLLETLPKGPWWPEGVEIYLQAVDARGRGPLPTVDELIDLTPLGVNSGRPSHWGMWVGALDPIATRAESAALLQAGLTEMFTNLGYLDSPEVLAALVNGAHDRVDL